MAIKKMYYWKDKQGNVKQSEGIELEDYEKAALCKENLARVKRQAALNEMTAIAQENGEYGPQDSSLRDVPTVDECKILELPTKRTKAVLD
jgi:hypothetical protein